MGDAARPGDPAGEAREVELAWAKETVNAKGKPLHTTPPRSTQALANERVDALAKAAAPSVSKPPPRRVTAVPRTA